MSTGADERRGKDFSRLTVIVSCFNEEDTIAECMERIVEACPGLELIVLHGGRDGTLEKARETARRLEPRAGIVCRRHFADRGKGHAIKTGITMASNEYVCQFDADLQFYPEDIPVMLARMEESGADLVIGSRFLDCTLTDERYRFSFMRDVGNMIVNRYVSLVCGTRVSDVTTGSKLWRKSSIEKTPFKDDRYVYEMEIVVRMALAGMKLVEVPVRYTARAGGVSGHGSGLREKWSLAVCGTSILAGATLIRLGLW